MEKRFFKIISDKIDSINNDIANLREDISKEQDTIMFVKNLQMNTEEVFELCSYLDLLTRLKVYVENYISREENKDYNIIMVLEQAKNRYMNDMLNLKVNASTSSVMYNLHEMCRMTAYQKLIKFINQLIRTLTSIN